MRATLAITLTNTEPSPPACRHVGPSGGTGGVRGGSGVLKHSTILDEGTGALIERSMPVAGTPHHSARKSMFSDDAPVIINANDR